MRARLAAATLAVAAILASAGPALAATPTCHTRHYCVAPYTTATGTHPPAIYMTGPDTGPYGGSIVYATTRLGGNLAFTQQWHPVVIGTVAALAKARKLGLTATDARRYGPDKVYRLEYPGQSADAWCLAAGVSVEVRACNGRVWQAFIADPVGGWYYGLSVVPARNPAGHDALTAGGPGEGLWLSPPANIPGQLWKARYV